MCPHPGPAPRIHSPGVNTYFRAGAMELKGGVPLKYLRFSLKLPRTRRLPVFLQTCTKTL
jgi:hypothetical protein